MLQGGEDPRYIARRLIRFAAEDIGMADPAPCRWRSRPGRPTSASARPEGELALAQLVVHLGTAPKSNAVYAAFGRGAARRRRRPAA